MSEEKVKKIESEGRIDYEGGESGNFNLSDFEEKDSFLAKLNFLKNDLERKSKDLDLKIKTVDTKINWMHGFIIASLFILLTCVIGVAADYILNNKIRDYFMDLKITFSNDLSNQKFIINNMSSDLEDLKSFKNCLSSGKYTSCLD